MSSAIVIFKADDVVLFATASRLHLDENHRFAAPAGYPVHTPGGNVHVLSRFELQLAAGETSDANFSATNWWSAVQVPVVGAPAALSCTPSPVDGATGVAVGANITLTFNNALRAHAEDGIILTTAAGVEKACTRTIDAARKVLTLDPTTNLAAATDYLVIVPGVVDVHRPRVRGKLPFEIVDGEANIDAAGVAGPGFGAVEVHVTGSRDPVGRRIIGVG